MKNKIIILMLVFPMYLILSDYFIEPYDPNARIIKAIVEFINAQNIERVENDNKYIMTDAKTKKHIQLLIEPGSEWGINILGVKKQSDTVTVVNLVQVSKNLKTGQERNDHFLYYLTHLDGDWKILRVSHNEYASLTRQEHEAYTKLPEPSLGMNSQQVEKSKWGRPYQIKNSQTEGQLEEKWFYPDGSYVLFVNGFVAEVYKQGL
jgi:hypothetical protein